MMRLACQTIARRANREDNVRGRFFAGRFDCNKLETAEDVLACSLYVDLNWIHAGLAETPEQSRFTSAFDRIQSRWREIGQEMGDSASVSADHEADAWLAPIYLDERAEAYVGPAQAPALTQGAGDQSEPAPICNPPGAARISDKGFLPITRDQYLSLLDLLGRVVRQGKRGAIPAELPPILERFNVAPQTWLDSILERFRGNPPPRPALAVPRLG
jgi:hypothetical protein